MKHVSSVETRSGKRDAGLRRKSASDRRPERLRSAPRDRLWPQTRWFGIGSDSSDATAPQEPVLPLRLLGNATGYVTMRGVGDSQTGCPIRLGGRVPSVREGICADAWWRSRAAPSRRRVDCGRGE